MSKPQSFLDIWRQSQGFDRQRFEADRLANEVQGMTRPVPTATQFFRRKRVRRAPTCHRGLCHHDMERFDKGDNQLGYRCPSCQRVSEDRVACGREACGFADYVPNVDTGYYQCPGCYQQGPRCARLSDELSERPMSALEMDRVKRLRVARPRCGNQDCPENTIVHDRLHGSSCGNCGLVLSRYVIDDRDPERHFDDDEEREHEQQRQHADSVKDSKHAKAIGAIERRIAQAEAQRTETTEERFKRQVRGTWANSSLEPDATLIDEAASVLYTYSVVTDQVLPMSVKAMVYHCAALFVCAQKTDTTRRRITPVVLARDFLYPMRNKQHRDQTASETVRLGWLSKAINDLYMSLNERLPAAYRNRDDSLPLMYWCTVQSMLNEAGRHPSYPLSVFDVDRINATLLHVQTHRPNQAMRRKPRTVAAVIYLRAMRGTRKAVDRVHALSATGAAADLSLPADNSKVVCKMSIQLAASIMRVSKAIISMAKEELFPSNSVKPEQ